MRERKRLWTLFIIIRIIIIKVIITDLLDWSVANFVNGVPDFISQEFIKQENTKVSKFFCWCHPEMRMLKRDYTFSNFPKNALQREKIQKFINIFNILILNIFTIIRKNSR